MGYLHMGIFLGIAVAEDDGEASSGITAASSLKGYNTEAGGESHQGKRSRGRSGRHRFRGKSGGEVTGHRSATTG